MFFYQATSLWLKSNADTLVFNGGIDETLEYQGDNDPAVLLHTSMWKTVKVNTVT